MRRRHELAELRKLLLSREQTLGELRAHLISFEGRYLRQVGLLYRRLDEWEQKIAELHGRAAEPESESDEWHAEDVSNSFDPLVLKTAYRDLVKLLHPDFAADADDEQRRTYLMSLANEAYRRQDIAAIRRMLSGYDPALDLTSARSSHEEAVRLSAMIFQVTQDLEAANLQIEELQRSESAKLQQRTLEAARQGRDLLAEMAARVNGSIGLAMRRYELDLSRKQRPSKGMSVESLVTAEIKL
ncbi:hypothetical protein [Terriglobus aquaticus]|uniref:J domain-containing protein n=2 Tax=Terriglobus aquaticus TaxID=940139 RepID=A0ABW9KHG6_9BACT